MNNLQKAKEALKNPIPTKKKELILEEIDILKINDRVQGSYDHTGDGEMRTFKGTIIQINKEYAYINRDDKINGCGPKTNYGTAWEVIWDSKYDQWGSNGNEGDKLLLIKNE